ncbi:MAG: hypothetical protein U0T73_04390 [Chitinophagales bacterium]
MVEKFEFKDNLKKVFYGMIAAGVLGMVGAFFLFPDNHHSRFWSNILINTYFFTGIGIFGIFFVSANQLGYSGWITLVKRIYFSLSGFIKIGAIFGLLLVGGIWLHYHNLYDHWAVSEHAKELDGTKQTFLNPTFWTIRVITYFVLWIVLGTMTIKAIMRKDINNQPVYKRSKLMAALWIVVFAVTESFVSWDLIMSTDPHWYSTLFGWYNFASYGCAGFAFAILAVVYLKSKGYLPQVTENHLHDMGKYMFAFSIFWTYLWFSQFMLQWYGNIPEDTNYWVKRFNIPLFKVTIFLALALNFLSPLLIFLKRGAKRNFKVAAFIAVLVIIGHWLDFFNMVMPEPNFPMVHESAEEHHHAGIKPAGTALYAENNHETATVADVNAAKPEAVAVSDEHKDGKEGEARPMEEGKTPSEAKGEEGEEHEVIQTYAGFGIFEILIFSGFLGAFLLMFFTELSKDELFNENDPYLKESLRHHVEYA